AGGDAGVDRAGRAVLRDVQHSRAEPAGGVREPGSLLPEQQHARPGQVRRTDVAGSGQVVDADDRQPGGGGPHRQRLEVGMVPHVLVGVGDHRTAPVPPASADDVHLGGEEGVGVAYDGADVEVVLEVLDRDVERVTSRVEVGDDRVVPPVPIAIDDVAPVPGG